MKIIILSWHPGNTAILTAGGYTRFYELAKRCTDELVIIDKRNSLYRSLASQKNRIIEYTGGNKFLFVNYFSPLITKLIDRSLSIIQLCFILLMVTSKNAIIYVPYSELIELTIPAVFIKLLKRNKVVFCNLNVNTYFIDKPINVFLHHFSDCTITLSPDLKANLEKTGITIDQINGVGFDKQTLHTQVRSVKKYDAIYIGRHIPQKGIIDLIEIWNILVNKMHVKAHLITIGDIPIYMNAELIRKIKFYNLEEYISLKGKVSDSEKQKLLGISKIMVFPSRQEGWGIAPMEALANYLPVVAYELPIYAQSIGKTEALQKVAIGEWKQFAQRIVDILSNRQYYSSQAKKWQPLLNWDEMAKKELQIIHSVNQ